LLLMMIMTMMMSHRWGCKYQCLRVRQKSSE